MGFLAVGQNLQGTAVRSMELFSLCFPWKWLGAMLLQRVGFLSAREREADEAEKCSLSYFFFFFSLSSYLALPPSCRWQQPPPQRQRHLSPGLFLQSLFGSGVSSRTKAFPINNSRLRSLPLPLRHFILPSSIPGLRGRVVSRAQSRTSSYPLPS